jgi:hypothetical protein
MSTVINESARRVALGFLLDFSKNTEGGAALAERHGHDAASGSASRSSADENAEGRPAAPDWLGDVSAWQVS